MSNVDVIARRKYARLLRSLVTGRITNFEYEDRVNKTVDFQNDRAIWAVYRYAWYLYDDLHTCRLTGPNALTKEARREVAKWLLFLYTDLEYQWPSFKQRFSSLLFKLSAGKVGANLNNQSGDAELWPFFTREEFSKTITGPLHFIGPSNLTAINDTRTRLSRLLPYPVIWKAGFCVMILAAWVFLKWRSLNFVWLYLSPLIGCFVFVTFIMSLHARKKYSDLTWWQAVIILLSIFLSPVIAILLAKYLTN